MGAAVGKALLGNGHRVGWCAAGRSQDTADRATAFERFATLDALASWANVCVSVVPPHAAVETARSIGNTGFEGIYVDANAISPKTAAQVHSLVAACGATYIDGGIIGPPPTERGGSRLYLADDARGANATAVVASLFADSTFDAPVLDGMGPYAASALKMVYAAWTKGSAAMLLATAQAAEGLGVMEALRAEWDHSVPEATERLARVTQAAGPKAWRYIGEMLEIASTFESVGQPSGYHRAASTTYERVANGRSDRSQSMES